MQPPPSSRQDSGHPPPPTRTSTLASSGPVVAATGMLHPPPPPARHVGLLGQPPPTVVKPPERPAGATLRPPVGLHTVPGPPSHHPGPTHTVPALAQQYAPPPVSTPQQRHEPYQQQQMQPQQQQEQQPYYQQQQQQQPAYAPPPPQHLPHRPLPPTHNLENSNGYSRPTPNTSSQKIDPRQMPRPTHEPNSAPPTVFTTRSATARRVPPPAASAFRVVDNGNCSPRHLRMTTYAPPGSRAVWKQAGVPLAVLATPFADVVDGEDDVPVVYLGDDIHTSSSTSPDPDAGCRPPRCGRCGGYVCVFTAWQEGGGRWACHLCGHVNVTPPWYCSSLDGAGLRLDRASRPELLRGSVDYVVAAGDYGSVLQERALAFAVDVSPAARASGAALAAIDAVLGTLDETSAKVGVVAFDDKGVTFFRVRQTGGAAGGPVVSELVVDAEDPAAALPPSQWLVEPRVVLERLRRRIMCSADAVPAAVGTSDRACPLAAVRAVQQSLALAGVGGRVVLFSASPAAFGYGCGCNHGRGRELMRLYGKPEELYLYGTVAAALTLLTERPPGVLVDGAAPEAAAAQAREALEKVAALADACLEGGVAVDVFVVQQPGVDSALLAECCDRTGGGVYVCGDMATLATSLSAKLAHAGPADAAFKLRTSAAYRVRRYAGVGVYDPLTEQGRLAAADRDATACFVMSPVGGGSKGGEEEEAKVYVQLAVLHTAWPPDLGGRPQRRVRVHNLCLHSTLDPAAVFRFADCDATVAAVVKLAADRALRGPLGDSPWSTGGGGGDVMPSAKDITSTISAFFNDEAAGVGGYVAGSAGLTNDTTNHDNNAMAARPWLTAAVVDVLHRYRGVCAERTSRAQLVLPDALRLLPVYVLGALKHPAFLNGRGVRASERAVQLRRLRRLGVGALGQALYPRMTALRPYLECEEVEDVSVVPASSEGLASDGLYLLDDGGDDVWLWVGRAVPEELLGSPRLVTVCRVAPKIVRSDDYWSPDAERFGLRLVEDSIYGALSYADFLVKLHSVVISSR